MFGMFESVWCVCEVCGMFENVLECSGVFGMFGMFGMFEMFEMFGKVREDSRMFGWKSDVRCCSSRPSRVARSLFQTSSSCNSANTFI